MSRSQINLQDAFLNHVRKEKIPVAVNISGGGRIDGLVKGFDNFVILLKHDGQHLIYKHAINSIVPERAVELATHGNHSENEPREAREIPSPEMQAMATDEPSEPWVEG